MALAATRNLKGTIVSTGQPGRSSAPHGLDFLGPVGRRRERRLPVDRLLPGAMSGMLAAMAFAMLGAAFHLAASGHPLAATALAMRLRAGLGLLPMLGMLGMRVLGMLRVHWRR